MSAILRIIFTMLSISRKIWYKCVEMPLLKSSFLACGKNVYVGKGSIISYKNTIIGNDVSIGNNAVFLSTRANIIIQDKVMFGPNVTLITGDHRIDLVGRNMFDIKDKEKLPENDLDIVIESDVWVGANATILKGVTIGSGSVIAAGSVVTKNIEPYGIYAGVPAKKVRNRFSDDDLQSHKKCLSKGDFNG